VRTHLTLARVRRDADARVKESEERFRQVAENSPLMFWLGEADGRCSFLNERWYEFTGQRPLDALGRGWMDAIHPADQERFRREFADILKNQCGGRLGYRLRRHDGVYRWMLDTVTPRFMQGRFAGCVGSVIDITDEREEREVLARSRRHLEMALQAGRIGTFEWDIPTGQVMCSPELEALYGLEPGELEKTYRAWMQRIVPEDAAGFEAMIRDCFERGTEEVGYEFRILMPDGTRRWFEGKWRCTFTPSGRPRRMAGIHIDIDDRKRSELNARFLNTLNESLALLSDPEEILDTTAKALGLHLQVDACGFFTSKEAGGSTACEHCWCREEAGGLFADPIDLCTPLEVLQADGHRVVHIDDARRCVPGEKLPEVYNENVRAWAIAPFSRDGRWIASLRVVSLQPRAWHATELALIETVLSRVWPLVERANSEQAVADAEAKIRESEERLRATIEAAQLGTWSIYPGENRVMWDARCQELFRLPPGEEPAYQTFLASIHEDDRERVHQAVQCALLPVSGGAFDQEYRIAAGPTRWLRSSGRVFFEGGRPVRFLGTAFDITDLVKARETLAERRGELEQLVAERTARLQDTITELESFSYSISHDLRAPLRAMQSFAELLSEECGTGIGAEGRDYLRRIITASGRMDRLIQDVLVYSRVSRTELTLVPVDLQTLVDGIVESYPQFQTDHADIVIHGRLPCVLGNEAALMQCVANLVGNAIKFVAPGVRPRVEIMAEIAGLRVRLCVQDNGIGIAAEARTKIFGIFQRFNTAYEGTGIGLAVVRRAAERMGGEVSFTSEPGAGSRFCLDLALAS
jgi:PAS domain S-box-containing protein